MPLKHYHNDCYSQVPKSILLEIIFRLCRNTVINRSIIQVLSKKKKINTMVVSPGGQRRGNPTMTTSTSRPGKKETLNIMLREN